MRTSILWACAIALFVLLAAPLAGFAQQTSAVEAQQVRRAGPPSEHATVAELKQQAEDYLQQKDFPDALDYFQAALRKSPRDAFITNRIGIIYLATARLDEARKEFERAAKYDKTFAEPVNNIGVIYYMQALPPYSRKLNDGRIDKAIRQYEKALQLNANSAIFHSNLGTAYFEKKDFQKASREYLQAIKIDPAIFDKKSGFGPTAHLASPEERAEFSYTMAKLYAQTGHTDRALLFLRKAIEGGYPKVKDAMNDQSFASLRKDPRFADLMANKPVSIPE